MSHWGGVEMIDSMLAETGYAIPESQLPELADRIQFLENLVGGNEICDLLPDTTLLADPSDISSWINSLIKGTSALRNTPSTDAAAAAAAADSASLKPDVLLADPCSSSSAKDGNGNSMSLMNSNSSAASNLPHHVPVMMHMVQNDEEAEASGLRLIGLLLACATLVEQQEEVVNAELLVNEIRMLVLSMGDGAGAMGRVAMFFAQGLERRMSHARSSPYQDADNSSSRLLDDDPNFLEMLHLQFYHACPYLKFGHFTANQAMLEELDGEKAVHIIDLELGLGLQWPPLIHMLAIRPGGAPFIRFTAISSPNNPQQRLQVQQTGLRLTHLANTVNVDLRFQLVEDIHSVQLQPGEAVAINSMLQLHKLLYDATLITSVLAMIRRLNPRIFTLVEQDTSHNSDNFHNRFIEALHFYSSMFDSVDAAGCRQQDEGVLASEEYLGREIVNIVACEGKNRVERHERLEQWRSRLYSMGFRPRHLGANAYNQAATLLTIFPGGGHSVHETAGCLSLGWQSRPLIAATAWRCC